MPLCVVSGVGIGRAACAVVCFRVGRGRRGAGVSAGRVPVSVAAGVGAVWESVVACGARPGAGEGGGVRGTGKPGFGGFPGSPVPCRLPGSAGAAGTVVLAASVAMRAAGSVVPCAFHGHWCGGVRRGAGEVRRGSGGTSEPGRGLRGRGVPGFPQMPVPPFLLLPFRSLSRAVVFPTSPSCLVEGVRSGTRKRRGASTSVQAAGGTGAGTPRTSPAHACAGLVRLACGLWPGRARARRAGAPGPARAYKPAARVFAGRH